MTNEKQHLKKNEDTIIDGLVTFTDVLKDFNQAVEENRKKTDSELNMSEISYMHNMISSFCDTMLNDDPKFFEKNPDIDNIVRRIGVKLNLKAELMHPYREYTTEQKITIQKGLHHKRE